MEKTGNRELDELLSQAAAYCDEMRSELAAMRPQLLALRELYLAYIDELHLGHSFLFGLLPPLPSGGHAKLPVAVERECEAAVVRVLKRKLAKVDKALGN